MTPATPPAAVDTHQEITLTLSMPVDQTGRIAWPADVHKVMRNSLLVFLSSQIAMDRAREGIDSASLRARREKDIGWATRTILTDIAGFLGVRDTGDYPGDGADPYAAGGDDATKPAPPVGGTGGHGGDGGDGGHGGHGGKGGKGGDGGEGGDAGAPGAADPAPLEHGGRE